MMGGFRRISRLDGHAIGSLDEDIDDDDDDNSIDLDDEEDD